MHKKYPHPPERIERNISAAASISMCVLTVLIQIATTLLLTAFLLVWCVFSLSGVSTFLYFNF